MRGLAAGEIATELAVLNDVDTLRRNTLVIVRKTSQPRTMFHARIRDNVDDGRSVFQMIELIESEKTGTGKICFLASTRSSSIGCPTDS